MSDNSAIEWTNATWSPVTGCDRVSPGCDHCYALTLAKRLKAMGSEAYQRDGDPRTSGPGFGVTLHPDRLDQPLRWRKPRRIFVNSMSDLFHKDIPDEYIAKVFAVMALAPQHTFQILTKRHGRMRSLLSSQQHWVSVGAAMSEILGTRTQVDDVRALPNAWLGVSAEDQARADLRIPALLATPAAVRFISAEPLLGAIDLGKTLASMPPPKFDGVQLRVSEVLHWVIVGGESGPGARPMHPGWARQLRDQCEAAGIAYFYKQAGEWSEVSTDDGKPGDRWVLSESPEIFIDWHPGQQGAQAGRWSKDGDVLVRRVGKKAAGRLLDGREHNAFPQAVDQ